MGNSKKIFFLILLLIILIISCVYLHTERIYSDTSKKPLKMVEKIVEPLENDVEEIVEKQEESKNIDAVEVKQEPVVQIINTTSEPVKISEIVEQKETPVQEEPKVEEKKIEFPLFITDGRYKRTNGDKNIEDLSEDTQLLQKDLYALANQNPIDFNKKYRPLKKSIKSIEEIAKFLKEHKHLKIEVAGHTTKTGHAGSNKHTSVLQAANVKKQLIKLGINKKRMKARGYGEEIPLVDDGYLEENKRIEFNIIGEKYK